MRILFIVEHYYPYIGGAEELWRNLAEHLVKESHHVSVLTTRYDKTLPEKEIIHGVNIYRLNVINRYGFTFFSIRRAIQLAKQVDIIHTSSYNAALPAWIASKFTSTKCIITFHEVWGKLWFELPDISVFLRLSYYYFESLLLNLKYDKFVAVSDFTLGALIKAGVQSDKCIRIYNGLDYAKIQSYQPIIRGEDFIFCYFGRLGLSKGYQFLIPAFAKLKEIYPKIKLKMIVPQYPDSTFSSLKRKVGELNLEQNIIWHHDLSKEELYREVSLSNAVVIPSLSEGFCFVAAETVALQIPIISSQKGALPEVVGGDFITIKALNETELFIAMESAILEKWEFSSPKYFPIENTINQYIELYTTILQK